MTALCGQLNKDSCLTICEGSLSVCHPSPDSTVPATLLQQKNQWPPKPPGPLRAPDSRVPATLQQHKNHRLQRFSACKNTTRIYLDFYMTGQIDSGSSDSILWRNCQNRMSINMKRQWSTLCNLQFSTGQIFKDSQLQILTCFAFSDWITLK